VRTATAEPTPAQVVARREAATVERHLVMEGPAPEPPVPARAVERPTVTEPVSPLMRAVETRAVDRLRIERRSERPAPQSPAVRAANPPAARSAPEPEQVVHVHIGRIEVRAPAPPTPRRSPPPREPTLSLAEYLGQRGTR
jgi:hypothetical protein